MHRKLNKIIQEADWPSRLAFCFFWNIKFSILLTLIRIHLFYRFLLFAVTHYHFLLLAVILCHSLSLTVHSLSLFVTRCITRCHSMSLDVPLVCLFINDNYFIIFCFLHLLQYFVAEVRRDGGREPRIRAEGRGSRNTNTFFSRNQ